MNHVDSQSIAPQIVLAVECAACVRVTPCHAAFPMRCIHCGQVWTPEQRETLAKEVAVYAERVTDWPRLWQEREQLWELLLTVEALCAVWEMGQEPARAELDALGQHAARIHQALVGGLG